MKITTFSFPDVFSFDGNVIMKEGQQAINQNLGLMVLCFKPQLFGSPNYGSSLDKYIYIRNTNVVREQIKDDLVTLINRFDSRVIIRMSDATVVGEDNKFYIQCPYYLKSFDSKFTFSITLNNDGVSNNGG